MSGVSEYGDRNRSDRNALGHLQVTWQGDKTSRFTTSLTSVSSVIEVDCQAVFALANLRKGRHMRVWQIVSEGGVDVLDMASRDAPTPGAGQVKVAVKASSINYRDLATITNPVARGLVYPVVPNSDCAGEIVAVGDGVDRAWIGKRVTSCFFQDWQSGPCSTAAMSSALGGALDGVLAEEVLLNQTGCIEIPDHMSYEQASTLPCAALTAWNALMEVGQIDSDSTVLLLGTGGVSIFALQMVNAIGARAIITSSCNEKLKIAQSLGAWKTVNYHEHPDWEKQVLDITNGHGVDLTVEVGGAGTLQRSIEATRVAGAIGLIGILTGGKIDPVAVMRKSIRLQGIYVGSRDMFADMNQFLAKHYIEPMINKVFEFDDAREAYRTMESAGHLGKIVIKI